MYIRNKVLTYPDRVQKQINEWIDTGKRSAWIRSAMARKFPQSDRPSIPCLNRYIDWYLKAQSTGRGTVKTGEGSATVANPLPKLQTSTSQEAAQDLSKVEQDFKALDLSSGKDTLEKIKERIRDRIIVLEHEQHDYFDKYKEQVIQRYYDLLSKAVRTDVELASELKDSDKIPISAVKHELNMLFLLMKKALDKSLEVEKVEQIINELKDLISRHKSEILEVPDETLANQRPAREEQQPGQEERST
jgi:hypothetical protein